MDTFQLTIGGQIVDNMKKYGNSEWISRLMMFVSTQCHIIDLWLSENEVLLKWAFTILYFIILCYFKDEKMISLNVITNYIPKIFVS